MRAVAVTGERTLQVVHIDRPVPGPGEVLLDVSFCGICGSDLRMMGMPAGHVLGHEFTGVIAALGPQTSQNWQPGDRVAVLPILPCTDCYACRRGRPNLCDRGGIDIAPGIGRPGGYAESVVVPTGMLRRLPDSLSAADGALAEPLAVAIRAIRRSATTPDEPVCVLGAGPIGILAVAGLLARGHRHVAVVEPSPGRRDAAQQLGVAAVPPDQAADGVPALLGGEPPVVVIDCTGHPSAAPLALDLLPATGRLTIAGLPDGPVPLDLGTLAVKEITVRGSLIYTDDDFTEALGHLAVGRIPCAQIVTTIAPLEQAQQWFTDLVSSTTRQVKVLLDPR